MRLIRAITLPVVASALMYAQSPPARPEFEVASIRPSEQTSQSMLNVGLHIDGAQVRCTDMSLKDYLAIAYNVKNYQISGPDWLASNRFDINAKLPDGAARKQVPAMLQALLESRFRITLHHESKLFPVYALVVAKGGFKIDPLPADPTDDSLSTPPIDVNVTGGRQGVSLNLGKGSSFSIGNNQLQVKKLTMTRLADMLARFMDRPVVDMTDLKSQLRLHAGPQLLRTVAR